MEELDTEKLETVVRILKDAGVAGFRFGELEIHFPQDEDDEDDEDGEGTVSAIGFEAKGQPDDPDFDLRTRRPDYSKLFPGRFPRLKRS